jgi:hypothetical protein
MSKPVTAVATLILLEEAACASTNRSTASCPSWPAGGC